MSKIITKDITQTKIIKKPCGVQLELTLEEAAALALILGDRCGSGRCGVYDKLSSLGFDTIGCSDNTYTYNLTEKSKDIKKLVQKVIDKYKE